MKFLAGMLLSAALLLASGCIHFDYSGETGPENAGEVGVFRDDACDWSTTGSKVLGKAAVWGDYREISRDALVDRLKKEAALRGANTVKIFAEQVVPDGAEIRAGTAVLRGSEVAGNSSGEASIQQMQSDFDGGYGKAELFGKNKPAKTDAPAALSSDYTRIIRAEFLVCKNPPKHPGRKRSVKPQEKSSDPAAVQEAPLQSQTESAVPQEKTANP